MFFLLFKKINRASGRNLKYEFSEKKNSYKVAPITKANGQTQSFLYF